MGTDARNDGYVGPAHGQAPHGVRSKASPLVALITSQGAALMEIHSILARAAGDGLRRGDVTRLQELDRTEDRQRVQDPVKYALQEGDRGDAPPIDRWPRARFAGMSYGEASRWAVGLIARADAEGRWYDLPEALAELRAVMERHKPETFPPEYMGR